VFIEWPEHDRSIVLESFRRDRAVCKGCNTFTHEWFDSEGRVVNPDDDPWILEKVRCPGCEMLAERQTEASNGGSKRPGDRFGYRRANAHDRVEPDDDDDVGVAASV